MYVCMYSVDTFASYGQLLSSPISEDAEIFDQVDLQASTQQAKQADKTQEERHSTEIVIDDPVKRVEQSMIPGMSGGFVTYRVFTKTTLPAFSKKEVSVRRRFREFVVRLTFCKHVASSAQVFSLERVLILSEKNIKALEPDVDHRIMYHPHNFGL